METERTRNTLCKAERLKSKTLTDKLFSGASKSFVVYPLRLVYLPVEKTDGFASILVSVPKKRFKRAVKRNRVKRQIREVYRTHKHDLLESLGGKEYQLVVAFIYLDNALHPTAELEQKMKLLLSRLTEKLE